MCRLGLLQPVRLKLAQLGNSQAPAATRPIGMLLLAAAAAADCGAMLAGLQCAVIACIVRLLARVVASCTTACVATVTAASYRGGGADAPAARHRRPNARMHNGIQNKRMRNAWALYEHAHRHACMMHALRRTSSPVLSRQQAAV